MLEATSRARDYRGTTSRPSQATIVGLNSWKLNPQAGNGFRISKRASDIALASFGVIAFFPIGVLIAAAILLEDGWPIFYSQHRIGRDGKSYKVVKFRSMIKNAELGNGPMRARPMDPRVTRVGRLLRPMAMDELPQLFAILKGDMSFVGPRSYREFFTNQFRDEVPDYDLSLAAAPGLTGLAQVYGGKVPSGIQKWRLDMLYISRHSFILDLKLILVSVWITLHSRWERAKKI